MARKATRTPSKSKAASKAQPAATVLKKPRRSASVEKNEKPVVRVGTWVTILVFALVIGLAVYLNRQKTAAAAAVTPTGGGITFVFPPEGLGNPSSIEIKPAKGDTVRVARNSAGAWAIELPFGTEADQGLVEAAASQVSALRKLGDVDLAPDVLGLDKPSYIITVKFTTGTQKVLEIGDQTPTNSGYYVRVDKKKTVIVSLSGIDALLNLAKTPPYLHTPTPSPLPSTETPIPPAETSTPESSVTATSTP